MGNQVANHSPNAAQEKKSVMGAMKKSIDKALGGINMNVRKVSIEYIVIQVMTIMGMDPLQLQISDLANTQNAGSEGQNDVTNLGAFLSYIESEVKGFGSSSSGDGGGLPSKFWDGTNGATNTSKLKQFLSQFKKYFDGDKANGTFSKFQFYFPGMSAAENKKLTTAMLSKFWANIQKGDGKIGGYIKTSGNISDIQMYMLMKMQYEIDKKYSANTSAATYSKLVGHAMSKLYNPENDAVVETGANGLWQDLNVGLASQTTMQSKNPNVPGFKNFLADLQKYINGGETAAQLSKIKDDFNAIAVQYYENNNPGSTAKSSTSTSSKPTGSMIANVYNSTSTAQSLSNTQNQQNTQEVQQTNSELTSDDKTGQSIITSFGQGVAVFVQNQKPA